MASIRVRHPNGVSTIQANLDNETYTVRDLQNTLFSVSHIRPSSQIIKSGYPPRSLTLIPELPVSSLGLKAGEQLIVSESSFAEPTHTPQQVEPLPTSEPSTTTSGGPYHVKTDAGVLIHRIVPDDNSCLFSSVALLFEQDISKAPQMRKLVADGIKADPEKYNEAILGMPPAKYISTILGPSSWGGAIELTVLAAHFHAEIASVDVETGRIDFFSPQDSNTTRLMRGILLYSGVHYDVATLAPMSDAPDEWHQTLFPAKTQDPAQDQTLAAAKELASILRANRAYTNTATFDLKCEQCGEGLKGEKGARVHAEQTGHLRFGEY